MGGSNSWRTPTDGADYMRGLEKRLLHEERRPNIRTASDLLGPGISPYCVRIEDWNADETLFNGFWYTEPGAFNQPVADRYWMGYSLATEYGNGLERVTEYAGPTAEVTWPRPVYVRRFWTASPDTDRQWSLWRIEDGNPPGLICEYGAASGGTNYSTGNDSTAWTQASGFTITRQETRRVGQNLLYTDVEWSRTGGTVTMPVSGDIANTLVATLSSNYTLLSGQNALSSGQEGRVAHYNLYASNRQVSITSAGGTVDYPTAGATGSFGGVIPVAAAPDPPVTSAAPNGWFYCAGQVVSRASYPDLFAVIGTRWNTGGEASTSFRLPALPGKVIRA